MKSILSTLVDKQNQRKEVHDMAERENIRSRLKKHQLTQVWLINQLGLRGIVTDKTEMSSVLAGTRSGSKADAIIELSHDILDKYEEGSVLVKE